MLGGLLSRQAEEEERQLREAEQQQQQHASHAAALAAVVSRSEDETTENAASVGVSEYGSLGGVVAENTAGGASPAVVGGGGDQQQQLYEDQYVDHGELEGEYSYSDDSGSDGESDDGESDDDDDGSGSDCRRHDDGGNEESSYLLRRRRRRRRRRRKGKQEKTQTGWKGSLRRFGSQISAAVVAIADVDNVWDSPDAASNNHPGRGGAYAEDPHDDDAGNYNGDNDNNNNATGRILYNVITGGTSTRNRTAAIFWFIFLITSYASERSTFKLLVDRVVPFRLFSAELILGAHALLTGLGMLIGSVVSRRRRGKDKGGDFDANILGGFGLGLPLADVGLMAVLDTIYLLLGVISGAHVPPVLTVILVQTTIPLTACFTQCVHPDGRCSGRQGDSSDNEESSPGGNSSPAGMASSHSNVHIISDMQSVNDAVSFPEISSIPNLPSAPNPPPVKGWGGLSRYHIIGTGLMFLAILLGLTPAVLSLDHIVITKSDAMPERTAYNTIVFCLAAVPAAMSQLYKEHTLTRLRQPIDRNTLNLVLSVFQLLFAIVVSPLAYGLQGMGDGPGWTSLYPSKRIGENFSHGLACFVGTLDEETMLNGYPEMANCDWALALVLLHVLSIVLVGVAIDKLAAATKVMYRGVSMGIIFAVILMFVYQIRDQWCEYGPLVSFFHLTATAVLIVGAEIYHRVSLVDASFETVYPEIGDLYDEEE